MREDAGRRDAAGGRGEKIGGGDVSRWISVEDRLPPTDQNVLIYAIGKEDGFIGQSEIAISSRFIQKVFPSSPGHERWSSPWQYFLTDYEITHWMPLPEPPTGLTEEGPDR